MRALKLPKFIVAGFVLSSCSWDYEGEDAEEKRRLKDAKNLHAGPLDTGDWGGTERRIWQRQRDSEYADIDEIHEWNDLNQE